MTRDEAEALRQQPDHWTLGLIYSCAADPRVIVRNRLLFGWTPNFGHRWAFPTLLGFVVVALGPAGLLFAAGVESVPVLLGATAAGVLLLVGIAHRVASGPR